MAPTKTDGIVTVQELAAAARALLNVVNDRRIRGAAIQADLPLYECAADLLDLLERIEP